MAGLGPEPPSSSGEASASGALHAAALDANREHESLDGLRVSLVRVFYAHGHAQLICAKSLSPQRGFLRWQNAAAFSCVASETAPLSPVPMACVTPAVAVSVGFPARTWSIVRPCTR